MENQSNSKMVQVNFGAIKGKVSESGKELADKAGAKMKVVGQGVKEKANKQGKKAFKSLLEKGINATKKQLKFLEKLKSKQS